MDKSFYPCRGFPKRPTIVDVPADGSCLFHAAFVAFFHAKRGKVLDPMKRYPAMKAAAQRLREAVVKYIVRNYHRPLGGVKGNPSGRELVTMEYVFDPDVKGVKGPMTYAAYMGKYTTYGGETELQGLSGLLKCGIVVHPFGNTDKQGCEKGNYYNVCAGQGMTERMEKRDNDTVIHLYFDEHAEHYKAVLSRGHSP